MYSWLSRSKYTHRFYITAHIGQQAPLDAAQHILDLAIVERGQQSQTARAYAQWPAGADVPGSNLTGKEPSAAYREHDGVAVLCASRSCAGRVADCLLTGKPGVPAHTPRRTLSIRGSKTQGVTSD